MLGDRKNLEKREPKEIRHSNRKIVSQSELEQMRQQASGGQRRAPSRAKMAGGSITGFIVIVIIYILTNGQVNLLTSDGGGYESGGYEQSQSYEDVDLSLQNVGEIAPVSPQSEKPYTILVYMNGTDLESKYGCATSDLKEMLGSGFDSEKINLIILTGGTREWKNNIISDNTSIYHMEGNGLKQLADLGEASIADERVLKEYIDFGVKNFPAQKYGFIFWNHGGGTIHGYGSDQNYQGAHMTIAQIEDALSKSAMQSTKFEFIGFDACLMATLETGYLLSPYANYLIASEESEPGYGWDYNSLSVLSQNTDYSGADFGKDVVDRFVQFYANSGEQATLSVVELSKLLDVSEKFERFSSVAHSAISQGGFNTISKARKGTKSFGYTGEDRSSFDIVDIKHLAVNLQSQFPQEAGDLIDSVENAVVYFKNSANVANAYGISTYVPYAAKQMAPASVEKYSEIGVMPDFVGFLQDYTQQLTGARVHRSNFERAIPVISNEDVSIKLSPEQLEEINKISFVIWRQLEPGSDYFVKLGLDSDVEIDPDGTIKTTFDGYWLTLGGQTACFYEVESADNYQKYSTPATLNGEDVSIIVMADESNPNGKILGAIPESPEGDKMAPKYLQPINPGDTLALKYFAQLFLQNEADAANYTEAEQWLSGDEFIVPDVFEIEVVPVDDELYLYGFWIEDTQNNNYYTDFIEIEF